MKNALSIIFSAAVASSSFANAQSEVIFYHELWQVQLPTGVESIVALETLGGERTSELAIDPGGARFELWTFADNDITSGSLLDHKYVSTYTPVAEVRIATEDPYDIIPRTRADRPFNVVVTPYGLLPQDDPDAPDASKKVTLTRHVQSYGLEGTGENLDRTQATQLGQVTLTENKNYLFQYPINSIPAADRTKVRGEERFSVYSLEHIEANYQVAASQLATLRMQVWPVAEGDISGITEGQVVRFDTPQITLTYKDLYPDSRTYAQLYPGPPVLGTEGTAVPGSAWTVYASAPDDETLMMDHWDTVIDQDGQWTMEILTATPFGIDRLDHVSFNVNRSIKVRGSMTTLD